MSRTRLLVALALLAAAIVAVLFATGALSGSTKGTAEAAAPECLPSTLDHDARLPGTTLSVSPAPNTTTASPQTQISFLGAPAGEIREVSVRGARSGPHPGTIKPYSQGDGASFMPETPFQPGERVSVRATLPAGTSTGTHTRKTVEFGFVTDTPYSTTGTPPFPNPKAAPADYESFATLPGAQVPILTVASADRDPAAGDVLTTNGPGPGQFGPLIYTPQGGLVWFDHLPQGQTAENLSVQRYQGRPALTFWRGKVLSLGFGQGEDVVLDSAYREIAKVTGGNGLKADLHDFQIAPDNVSYTTAFNPIHCDLSSVQGVRNGVIVDTAIQQIDMRTGLVRWEWHSLDHVAASESETTTPTKPTPWDWFHINSIDPQANGDLFISARSTWAGYQIEADTGKILWRLGGLKSTFKLGHGVETAWQHDGRILPSGLITFFDDGSNPPIHSQSRGLQIALDFKTHTARLLSSYTHPDPPLLAPSQGNMQTLPDGNAVVGYGGVPAISEFAPNGSLLFDAHLPYDMSFYRAFRFPWSARPASPPAALANLNDTSEETIVHMSWNGATGVASWRVLAGKQAGSLQAQTTIPASGFESSTTLPNKYAYAAVQALDAAGRVLGSSKPVAVSSYAAALPNSGNAG